MIRALQPDRPARLLIADDDRNFAANLADLARLHCFETTIVHSFAQAEAAMKGGPFDVAVVDHGLPDGHGLDLLGRWRTEHPDLVPIVSTAFASVDSTLAALNLGAFAFVTKDSEPEVIVDALLRAAENAALRRENRRLRTSQEAILAAIPDLLVIVDEKLSVLSANHRDPQLCRRDPGPQLPCTVEDFFLPDVSDRIEWRHLVLERCESPSREASLTLRTAGTEKTRTYGIRSTRLKPVGHGSALIQIIDLTDRVDLVRRLSESEGLATLGRLVAIIAHELRNPITGIRALAQMLRKTLDNGHADGESITEILTLTDRMSATLADILAYSRPRDWKEEAIHLDEMIGSLVKEGRRWPACEGRTLELEPIAADVSLVVFGERDRLFAALSNVVENALHACAEGGRVRVRLTHEGAHAAIAVEDDGPGIPDSQAKRIFDPFYSTKKGGTGLGLPIVKTTVDRYGGTIEIGRSSDLGGAAIVIRLPLDRRAPQS